MSTTKERLHRRELLLMKEHGDATERHRAIERKSHERAVAFFESTDANKDGTISEKEFEDYLMANFDQQHIRRKATLVDDNAHGINHACTRCCCFFVQSVWGVLGTLLVWVIYLLSAVTTFPATICFCLTWMLEQMCQPFEEKTAAYILQAEVYIGEAKIALAASSEQAETLLKTFRGFKDIQRMFNTGGMGQGKIFFSILGRTCVGFDTHFFGVVFHSVLFFVFNQKKSYGSHDEYHVR